MLFLISRVRVTPQCSTIAFTYILKALISNLNWYNTPVKIYGIRDLFGGTYGQPRIIKQRTQQHR